MEKKQKPTLKTLQELTKMEDQNLQEVAKEAYQRVEKREEQELQARLSQTPLSQTGE